MKLDLIIETTGPTICLFCNVTTEAHMKYQFMIKLQYHPILDD